MKNLSFILSFLFILSSFTNVQAEDYGVASFYSDAFQGRKTASGELYDQNKMTAAHKELPFGTMIKVTRLDNKKSVILRVNDRGPFISGRVVEVSKVAAQKLDLIRAGIAEVKVEVVTERDPVVKSEDVLTEKAALPTKKDIPTSYDNAASQPVVKVPAITKEVEKAAAKVAIKKTAPKPTKKVVKSAPKVTSKKEKLVQDASVDLYKIQLIKPAKTGFGVQVAYFTDYENVFRQVTDLQSDWFKNILISTEKKSATEKIYRVILGPFPDQKTAVAYKASLQKKKKLSGFVVDLSTL